MQDELGSKTVRNKVGQCLGFTMVCSAVLLGGRANSAAVGAEVRSAPVVVNRTIPQVTAPKPALAFSASPTAQEIFRARVFEEPLVPIGGAPDAAENAALAKALIGYSQRTNPDDFSSLTGFLEAHPKSPWQAALLTDLGLEYYNTAHYSKTFAAWSEAWKLSKDVTDAKGKAIADRAAGELASMYARLGRITELEALLKSVEVRQFVGAATEKIANAREGLWNMQNRPEISFRCGPFALHRIKVSLQRPDVEDQAIFDYASTQKGCSMSEVAELSKKVGLNYQMAFRLPTPSLSSSDGERVAEGRVRGSFVVPSVVHWKVGHYAALVRQEGDRYLLQDPTFGNDVWATRATLDTETSGYFLLPSGNLPLGWRAVDKKEGASVWGKGFAPESQKGQTAPGDHATGGSCGGGDGGGGGQNDPHQMFQQVLQQLTQGMAVVRVHLMLVNLNLNDEPVGYSPPVGPAVRFTVRYNHREAFQPANFTYSNFGAKWTCDWISYITDNPQSSSADVNYYVMGGGTRTFTGFNTNTQTFAFQRYDQTQLTRTAPGVYQMLARDGSKLIFSQSDGAIGTSRKIFLSQILDPFGNAVTLTYDGNLRLTAITDAIGQVTTIAYAHPTDIYKITKVADPFGRFAMFDYDATNRLSKITDVIGLTSQFTYEGTGDFINSLITPYGTNGFTRGGTGTTRWLETAYPDGSRDRVEYNQTVAAIALTDPASAALTGMAIYNQNLRYRNTFYWSRNACAQGYGDYTKARIYHWLHSEDINSTSGVLQSTKEPLEGRVWYDYAGQTAAYQVGNINQPSHIGRVLDDGSTQLYTYAYDGFGHVTNSVDPVGRTMSYLYSTNGIDLLEIRMTRAGKNELLSKTTYNAQHLPLTQTDAAGQTTTNTYNARGQLVTTANPKGETTTYIYDPNGYLIMLDRPLPGTNDTVSATYDSFGRTRTKTDGSGYTLTLDHDDLDRITKVTFPDGTFSQYTFDRLDAALIRDRAGRQTLLEHDAMRQLVKRTDPLNRVTLLQWCSCGDLSSLTDPMGRTTTWHKDVQGRLTSKEYGDGSQVRYAYESATSRLRQVVDEKLQNTAFTFNRDNTLKSIAYANTTVPTPGVSYTYDTDYQRVVSMVDGIGTTRYTYNPITGSPTLGAGRLASEDGPLTNVTISYEYDTLGRRVSTSINGIGSRLFFDAVGRVISETNSLGVFTRTFDANSTRILSEVFPNGQTAVRSYGAIVENLALQRITYKVGLTPVSDFIYSHDPAERLITTWSQQAGTQTPDLHTFGYDAANQLLSDVVTNNGITVNMFNYVYDEAGNRAIEQIGATTNVLTFNPLNQVSTSTGAGSTRTNEWDGKNRLVSVTSGNQRTEFGYFGNSRLASIRKLVNGFEVSHRRFVWSNNMICEERDASGAVTKRYFQQGMRVETGLLAGNYYYTRDHLAAIRELTDTNGAVRARYSYDPFGRRTHVAGDLDADFGFAGMFTASEANLCLATFRAYDPDLGRWLSRDPLRNAEEKEGPNLYAYVGNNPVNTSDPLGLSANSCCEADRLELEKWRGGCAKVFARANDLCDKARIYTPEIGEEECLLEQIAAVTACAWSLENARSAARDYYNCFKRKKCTPDEPCSPSNQGQGGGEGERPGNRFPVPDNAIRVTTASY